MQENQLEPERAYLVGVSLKGSRPLLNIQDSLDELVLLANTAGMQIVGTTTQNVAHIDPATFIGKGRVEEIVHSKPRHRRLLIEEAAGLGKHRKRRRRAELRLDRTQENLDRALDVEREARRRLRPLKQQAQAADILSLDVGEGRFSRDAPGRVQHLERHADPAVDLRRQCAPAMEARAPRQRRVQVRRQGQRQVPGRAGRLEGQRRATAALRLQRLGGAVLQAGCAMKTH